MQMTKTKTTTTKFRFFWPLSKVMLGTTGAFLLGGVLLLQTKTFAAPGDGPVVQYSFEDSSNLWKDSSSAGNHATNNGVTQTLGRVGKAAHFNANSVFLDLSAHASKLNLTEGTVSFWAKADSDAADFSPILAWGTSAADGSTYDWGYIWLGNETYWYPDELLSFANGYRGVGDPYRAFDEVTRPDTFYKDGKWHAYTVTMDSDKKLWLYIDGQRQINHKNGQSLTPFFLSHNNNRISIWHHHLHTSGPTFLKGAIDELKIYNYARTAAQIKADYEQEAKPALIIHYEDENGEQLIPPTMHTTNPWGSTFQLNQTYTVNPAKLNEPTLKARFDTPDSQNVTFTTADRVKEVTFVYKRPRLVLHYTFDEGGTTVADSSQLETKNPGTVIGTPTRSERGRVGGMYTNTTITPQNSLGIGGNTTAFTIAGWVKTDEDWIQRYFISNAPSGDGYRFGLSDKKVAFLIGNGHTKTVNYTQEKCGTRDLNDNKWHHLVWVFDAKGKKVVCYVDGVKDWEVVLPHFYMNRQDQKPWIAGKTPHEGTAWREWSIDDVRVYNYALSAQKVKELYDSFPAEETSAPVGLSLTTTSPRTTLVVWEKVVASANIDLNRAGKDIRLVMTIPKTLVPESNSISLLNGENVLSGQKNELELADKRVYTYSFKDGLRGQIKTSFILGKLQIIKLPALSLLSYIREICFFKKKNLHLLLGLHIDSVCTGFIILSLEIIIR